MSTLDIYIYILVDLCSFRYIDESIQADCESSGCLRYSMLIISAQSTVLRVLEDAGDIYRLK